MSRALMIDAVTMTVRITDKEKEILILLSKGMRRKEIGSMLYIQKRTVYDHISRIVCKLNASNVTEAVANAIRLGIIE